MAEQYTENLSQKEYGGYIQLDEFTGQEYYHGPHVLALNSGRTTLRFLIRVRKIKKLLIPSFCCDTVREACEAEGISWEYYATGPDLRPKLAGIGEIRSAGDGRDNDGKDNSSRLDQWLYLVNLYGILTDEEIQAIHRHYPQMIADYTHAFFQRPLPDVDTLYSCRKFFGVADGAYVCLRADSPKSSTLEAGATKTGIAETSTAGVCAAKASTEMGRAAGTFAAEMETEQILAAYRALPLDASHDRMHFLLGRYEGPASDFYGEYAENNELFSREPIKQMSPLTRNLLRAVDYERVRERRTRNFCYLHERLRSLNRLNLPGTMTLSDVPALSDAPASSDIPALQGISGAYAYPFWPVSGLPAGAALRQGMIQQKVYVPCLWPEVGGDVLEIKGDTPEVKGDALAKEGCPPENKHSPAKEERMLEEEMAQNILPLPVDQRYSIEDMEEIVRRLLSLF